MSEKNIKSQENMNDISAPEVVEASETVENVSVAVKKKRFKKSDILVFAICLVASCVIWLYASNVQKNAEQKEISKDKEVIADAIGDINKSTDSN